MSRLLRFISLPFLLGGLDMSAQTSPDSGRPPDAAETLLRIPETLIEGLQPFTAKTLDASPQVIDARLKALAAAAREDKSRSLTRPRADLSLDVGYRAADANSKGSFQTYYYLGVSQPLWHWNALDNQKRIERIRRQLADNDYDEARRTLVLDIRQRYLALVLQKLDLAAADAACERQGNHLKASNDQAARGQLSADVLTGEQLDVQTAEVARDRQREDFERALRDFAVINGLPSFSAASLPSEIPGVPPAALALLPSSSPAIASGQGAAPVALARAEGDLKAAQLNEEIIRVRQRPMVDLAAGANQGQTSGADQTAVLSYFGGVHVSWNIFDGLATRAAVREAKVNVRQNQKALDDARIALDHQLADGATDMALTSRELAIEEARFTLMSSRQQVDEDLRKSGRLAESDWQERRALAQTERSTLYRLRGQLILQLAEQELLRQRATKPSKEIPFP